MKNKAMTVLLASLFLAAGLQAQAPAEAVRTTFDRFVRAQNDHDLKAVEALLADTPDFLWITRGTPVWGRAEALSRFEALYKGTWHLDPEEKAFRVVLVRGDVAQVFVPITFAIGAPGQPAQTTRFLMNQTLVKTESGWKVASILPIPVPPPAK